MEAFLMENMYDHYGKWWAAGVWIILYGVMILFTPFYSKSKVKPVRAYLAFISAFHHVCVYTPEGVFQGHTLCSLIGYGGMSAGALLLISGWGLIHDRYWKMETGEGELVTGGIYNFIRHPQYTGIFLITLGMIAEWATIPLVLMWPYLFYLYYQLARKEERDMALEFGGEYLRYKEKTGMFLPKSGKEKRIKS